LLKTVEKHIKIAERIAKRNHGRLPCCSWLVKKGYSRIIPSIKKYPERFSHIKQEHKHMTVDEQVKIAEKLSKRNKGLLPCSRWLANNGYSRILPTMKKFPRKFKHIKREIRKIRITLQDQVKRAEKLVRQNKGLLPTTRWLLKHGYNSLVLSKNRHKDQFKHLRQERVYKEKPIEECVKIAEELAKKNNGLLNSAKWLTKHKYYYLYTAIKKYPGKFKHIKRQYKRTKPKEYIKLAEKLAKKNDGLIPCHKWLLENGYRNLSHCITKYPDKFKHLEQQNLRKAKLENYVRIAEELAKGNNNILPHQYWLAKNGYSAIVSAMNLHPDKFSHIKQEFKGIRRVYK